MHLGVNRQLSKFSLNSILTPINNDKGIPIKSSLPLTMKAANLRQSNQALGQNGSNGFNLNITPTIPLNKSFKLGGKLELAQSNITDTSKINEDITNMIDLKKFASCSNSTKNATISICRQIVETRDFSTFLNSSIE
jgi:hypothetical protein